MASANLAAPTDKWAESAATPTTDQINSVELLWRSSYRDLRSMARARLRKHGDLTLLDTTGLVHESFLRMSSKSVGDFPTRAEFFGYAATVMRSIVVNLAIHRKRLKCGGVLAKESLSDSVEAPEPDFDPLEIHEALLSLEALDARLCKVVELRYFAGLSMQETAIALNTTERTVSRDWAKARMLLRTVLEP